MKITDKAIKIRYISSAEFEKYEKKGKKYFLCS